MVETLLAMPDLKAEVDAAIRTATEQQSPSKGDQIAKLKDERAAITRKITVMLDMVEVAEEEAKAKIFILKGQQRQIDDQLRLAAESVKTEPQDPSALAASVMERLQALGTSIGGMPTYQLRQVLASLIASATISMTTYEVEIMLRVPQAAFLDAKTAIETLSLRQTSPSSTASQDNKGASLAIARIVCEFSRQQRQTPCFLCRRRAA